MVVYFAPLEGVTDIIFRKTHREMFSGVTKYFIPFVSPTQHMTFSSREQAAIAPENNAGVPVVCQVLTKEANHFTEMTKILSDKGYTEVNLNLGCPSGTVTAKGKGSGMLREPDRLHAFLSDVYASSALPVSVKTRIGFESPDEWPRLLSVFEQFPISEFIVHPRTRQQFYKGNPHREILSELLMCAPFPVVYNGDLFTKEDCKRFLEEFPGVSAVMLGRGLIANPALSETLTGGENATRERLYAFHNRLFEEYLKTWPKNALVGHMHEIMYYMGACFENAQKARKAIRKSGTIEQYLSAARLLFENHALSDSPGFIPYD
ncbi:MAG: tRNA-dihydrouridine synthase family protein [Clostridia bacterium]|nr:tRNA-dihydrouridine synthase family protein [Clostridia bacterium]